jgi:hypothetical protein
MVASILAVAALAALAVAFAVLAVLGARTAYRRLPPVWRTVFAVAIFANYGIPAVYVGAAAVAGIILTVNGQ